MAITDDLRNIIIPAIVAASSNRLDLGDGFDEVADVIDKLLTDEGPLPLASPYTPTWGGSGLLTVTPGDVTARYLPISGKLFYMFIAASLTLGGTTNTGITVSLPVNSRSLSMTLSTVCTDGGTSRGAGFFVTASGIGTFRRFDGSNWTLGAATVRAQGIMEAA